MVKPVNKKFRILVIDDEEDVRTYLSFLLKDERWEVVFAEGSMLALHQITRIKPDLIILDVMMPGLTGLEFLNQVRGRPDTHRIPILMLTADERQDSKDEAFLFGADAYLTKPIDAERLFSKIEKFLPASKI